MPDTSSQPSMSYPTKWHVINDPIGLECRQISVDTYELRTATHVVRVNKEGFDLYRESDVLFDKWLKDNNIPIQERHDLDGD